MFEHELGHAFYHRANRSLGFCYVGRENEIFARACENLDLGLAIEDAQDLVRLGFEDWKLDGAYYYLNTGMKKEPYDAEKLAGYVKFLLHFTLDLKVPVGDWFWMAKHRKLITKLVPGSRACLVF